VVIHGYWGVDSANRRSKRGDDLDGCSVKETKQKKYLDNLAASGKSKVTVVTTIKREHEIYELAEEHRLELKLEKEGVKDGIK
tara:strand:- start:493 stop:741 length:249 start_codon:yes stop_codon:yes gene_type:complete